MGVEIDKPWGDDQPIRINGSLSETLAFATDLGDLAVFDPDVSLASWGARAIDDRAAFNVKIIFCHCVIPPSVYSLCV